MNARDATVSEHLIDLATRIRKSAWPRSQPVDELPLRSELFSADQMEQYGTNTRGLPSVDQKARLRPAADAPGRQRKHAAQRLQPADRGGHSQSPADSGRRMAARQSLSDPGADSNCQASPAQGLQPRAAAIGARVVGRPAARIRHRLANHLPRRRPGRHRKSEPLCGGVSNRQHAAAGRTVGHSDHAAAGLDRKPASRRRARRGRQGGPQSRRHMGRRDDGNRRKRSQEPDPRRRGHGAVGSADDARRSFRNWRGDCRDRVPRWHCR